MRLEDFYQRKLTNNLGCPLCKYGSAIISHMVGESTFEPELAPAAVRYYCDNCDYAGPQRMDTREALTSFLNGEMK